MYEELNVIWTFSALGLGFMAFLGFIYAIACLVEYIDKTK